MLEVEDLRVYSITSWYQQFSHIAMETVFVEINPEVLKAFKSNDNLEVIEDDGRQKVKLPKQFVSQMETIFNVMGKELFVKNNWHAPMDAKMFSLGNALKAQNLDDIILYFTTSNIIQEDFSRTHSIPFCLALRKWISIHPASEFRCIVLNNILRAITPRDWPVFYEHFCTDGTEIIHTLSQFFLHNIRLKFPRRNYTFDVVLAYPDNPVLVDFGPVNSKVELYAFNWKEVEKLMDKETPEGVAPVFRYLEKDVGILSRSALNRQFRQVN